MKYQQKTQNGADNRSPSSTVSRRDFLKSSVGVLSALAILEVGGASLLFIQPQSLEGEFGGIMNAGLVDSFPFGSVIEFPAGRFFLIRSLEGGFLAVYQRCTHLGCTVSWKSNKSRFFCPCHASAFDIYGDVENSPTPRALDTFLITIEDSQVLVNTGQVQSRDVFELAQLVFA